MSMAEGAPFEALWERAGVLTDGDSVRMAKGGCSLILGEERMRGRSVRLLFPFRGENIMHGHLFLIVKIIG